MHPGEGGETTCRGGIPRGHPTRSRGIVVADADTVGRGGGEGSAKSILQVDDLVKEEFSADIAHSVRFRVRPGSANVSDPMGNTSYLFQTLTQFDTVDTL